MNAAIEKSSADKPSFFALWKEDVRCVFSRDPAARNVLEVLTTYPGVHAILFHRISNKCWRSRLRFLARFLSFIARTFTNVDIHPGASIGRRFFIDHGAGVVIGETAIIGNDVTIYHGVTLGGTTWNKGRRHPTLQNGVLVGTGAKVLGPITVGQNARIGANSVVVENVPVNSTVVGIPGRVVNGSPNDANLVAGVNLNHHLIPDPVGKAIACMLERIDSLEKGIKQLSITEQQRIDSIRDNCEVDNDICRHDCIHGRILETNLRQENGSSRL